MGELFERKVILDIYPATGAAKRIDGLRINFEVAKTSKSTPNRSTIKVFNLNENSRSLFAGKETRVALQIGYLGLNPNGILNTGFLSSKNVELVFIGNITNFEHKKEKTDIITDMELGDGSNRFRNAKIEKGYPENTSLSLAIDDVIEALGLKRGPIMGIPNRKYKNGLVVSGLAKDQLDKLCAANDLEWSIQDETVQIFPRYTTTNENVILLNSKTGLIGSPRKTKDGIAFDSLIQPILRPGRKVKIESKFLSGTYKLRTVSHYGDSHSGTFLSKCEARA